MSSGPMPAASPNVKAMTGVCCVFMRLFQLDVFLGDQVAVAFVFRRVKGGELGLRHVFLVDRKQRVAAKSEEGLTLVRDLKEVASRLEALEAVGRNGVG